MKSIYIVCVAAVTLFAASDPTAWSKSSWGMSAGDLTAAFDPGQIVTLPDSPDNGVRITETDRFERAPLGIPSVDVAGTRFRVLFLAGNGLHQVNLTPIDPADASDLVFQQLESALTVKYGRPFTRSSETSLAQWKTPTSLIRLQFNNPKSIRLRTLWLIYSPLPKSDTL
jgi:hypothetical protein